MLTPFSSLLLIGIKVQVAVYNKNYTQITTTLYVMMRVSTVTLK